MNLEFRKHVAPAAALLLWMTVAAAAQSGGAATGEIVGIVVDSSRAPVAGATVTMRRTETNLVRRTTADGTGRFRVPALPPGTYEVSAEADGFVPRRAEIVVAVGTTESVAFVLGPSGASDLVEISAADWSGQIQTRTESGSIIDRQLISGLPINRRDFLDFATTSPRVTTDRVPAQGVAATSRLSFNGQSPRMNNLSIDGLDNNDRSVGAVRATFSQEAVREFQVVSDGYSAEFGRAAGGVVNIVTRSGANEFHGSLFEYPRNDALSARDVFADSKPPYEQHQFGGVAGGRLKRDKAFFFLSFERRSIRQNNVVTITDATIASFRKLGFTPRTGPVPFSVGTTAVLGRFDAQPTPSDSFNVRYNGGFNYDGAFEPFGGLRADTAAGLQRLRDNSLAAANIYSNPNLNLVNETRFLFSRYTQTVGVPDRATNVQLTAPEGQVVAGNGSFVPQARTQNVVQIASVTTLARGRHQIRFGADLLRYFGETVLPIFASGSARFNPLSFEINGRIVAFSGLQTFDPTLRTPDQRAFLRFLSVALPQRFPDFPAGVRLTDLPLPTAFGQGFGANRTDFRLNQTSAFVQDDFQVNRRFLVKAGFRYDLDRFRFFPSRNGNFSPRLALAWTPPRTGDRLTVRMNYGLFFGAPVGGIGSTADALATGRLVFGAFPFPFSVLPFTLPDRRFPPDAPPSGTVVRPQFGLTVTVEPNLRSSYTQQVSLGLTYAPAAKTRVSASYVFVAGRRMLGLRNVNPVVRQVPGDPFTSILTGRVDPTRGDVLEIESAFDSRHHGATVGFEHRATDRLTIAAHYTVSKTIDNFLDIRNDVPTYNDSLRPALDRGLSAQDVRGRFVASGAWSLPAPKNNRFLRDFQLSAIARLESGRPYNLLAGVDLNGSGDNPPADRPRVNGVPLGRNVGLTPGFASVDVRLMRSIAFGEGYRLELVVEAFNLMNRTNFSEIDNLFPPDAQGRFNLPSKSGSRYVAPRERLRNAFAPRQFQVGFRFAF